MWDLKTENGHSCHAQSTECLVQVGKILASLICFCHVHLDNYCIISPKSFYSVLLSLSIIVPFPSSFTDNSIVYTCSLGPLTTFSASSTAIHPDLISPPALAKFVS